MPHRAEAILASLRSPLGVKPAREGSSIGIYKVTDAAELRDAYQKACEHDPLVLVEEWVSGGEYTVSILGDDTLPVIGLSTEHTFYDFEAKYLSDDTNYLLPSGLSPGGRLSKGTLAGGIQGPGCAPLGPC